MFDTPIAKFIIIIFIVCAACSNHTDLVEDALESAGSNRSELESVLEHYSDEPMKLQAAQFLIGNMPGHYSYADTIGINRYYRAMDSLLNIMQGHDVLTTKSAIDSLSMIYVTLDKTLVQDVETITADFLIANIDSAFSKWRNTPWGKHLTFEEFCETLLPYKTEELQPFDNWRMYMPKSFPLDEGFRDCDQIKESPLKAAFSVHECLKSKLDPVAITDPVPLPVYSLLVKAKIPYGVCEDYASIATSAMRSHGIPLYNDFTPQWGYRNRLGHSWNVLLHNNGQYIHFVGGMMPPNELHKPDDRMAKAFRHTYARNMEIEQLINTEPFVPKTFQSQFIKDVTSQYAVCSDVEIAVGDIDTQYAYLAIFSDANYWHPVDFAKINNGKAIFHNVGRRCAYLPVYYNAFGEMKAISNPFSIEFDGNIKQLTTTNHEKFSIILKRKYPALEYVYEVAPRIVGGEFQYADHEDFSDAITGYTITDGAPITHEALLPINLGQHQYWRYIQNSPFTFCNIAEIAFYEPGATTPTYGKVLGTDGFCGFNAHMTKEKVFDGDILTAFDAPNDHGAWVGMDFSKPISIERICYTGRGDGNSIEAGDTYELFYWYNGEWASLGRQTATGINLVYNDVPKGALYLLRDLTKGQDERPFTYENGRQVWW